MPYCWKLVLCPSCNTENTGRIRAQAKGEQPPPTRARHRSKTVIRIATEPNVREDAPPVDLLRENLLAHRSFLMERERTLSADSPAVATLKRRLLELEFESAKIRAVLEETIGDADEDAHLPGIRAKIQAIDTLLSSD